MFDPILEASMSWDNNNQEDFTDFAILSQEGTRFPCHRVILGCQSPPMEAMMIRDHVMPGTRYSLDRVLDLGNFKA